MKGHEKVKVCIEIIELIYLFLLVHAARLLQTLSAVQGQLRDLEEENGISRRRVHELEMELEECKREVARERTRLFEREELSIRGHGDTSSRSGSGNGRGKAKTRDTTTAGGREAIDDVRLHERYKEVVEEKKGLFPIASQQNSSSYPQF